MISCFLAGGLGNMMFQVAAISAVAWKNNQESVFYLHNEWGIIHRMAHEYEDTIFRKLNKSSSPFKWKGFWTKWTLEKYMDFPYKELPYKKNSLWKGYFQSEKYFMDQKDKIKDLFSPRLEDISHIQKKYGGILKNECVSMHIRRGDYAEQEDLHPILPLSYYKEAIESLRKYKHILVFSDDIVWCKENLNEFPDYELMEFISDVDYVELYVMSMCKTNIIANSSFSWWAAWLNSCPGKIVIAPKTWFGEKLSHLDTTDMIPAEWIII